MDRSLGVVLPAYRPDVDALVAYVEALEARLDPAAIRIELDAPEPGNLEALREVSATVHVADHRRGKGAAITDGFEALGTDVLAFADADGSTPAESLAEVIEPVRAGEAAVAIGSRRHPASTVTSHQTFVRRRLGDAFAAVARWLLDTPVYDFQCGAKAVSREAWTRLRNHLYEPGFAWDVELVAMAGVLDLPLVEVPIVWEDQPGSTVSPLRTSVALGRALLGARHRAKLVDNDPLHAAIGRYRPTRPTLVERPGAGR